MGYSHITLLAGFLVLHSEVSDPLRVIEALRAEDKTSALVQAGMLEGQLLQHVLLLHDDQRASLER